MPLPNDPRMSWPPKGWEQVYQLYAEWDAWYSGDGVRLANVHARRVYTPTPRGRFWATDVHEERRVMLHVPIAGDIAGTSADLLFSEAPKLTIPEAHEERASSDAKQAQERLDELAELVGIHNRLLEAAESAAALGGVFLKPNWDAELAPYPLLSIAQADAAIPEFRWGILTAVTFWRVLDDDGQRVLRHLERHEPGIILHGLYRGTQDTLGTQLPLTAHTETATLQPEVRTGIEGLAARYVPNMRPNRRMRGSALGQSDYSGSEGMMDALDEVYTSWLRDVRLAKARILVPEEYLERDAQGRFRFDVDKEVFTPLSIDPMAAQQVGITPSQFEIRTEEHRSAALELLDRIIASAGYSPQSFGLQIEGRAESGTALRVRERKSLITKAKKERYWRTPLEDVLEMLLLVDREVFRSGVTVFRPSVQFGDSIAPDPAEVATTVEMLARAQAASIETRVRMVHPDWEREAVEAEVKRIMDEQGMQVPDPMQAGALT